MVRRRKSTNHQLSTINFKVKHGFTLIELLVVIFVLGILAGITMVSYSGTQERARDSRRKTDLDAIKKALELAKQDTAGAYYYPISTSGLATTYIKVVPTDPKTSAAYYYNAKPRSPIDCTTTTPTPTCTDYDLKACLENKNDSQKERTSDTTACPDTNTRSYSITPN
jgi:general secretion pathway protein G